MAETYNIYDYRRLSPTRVAAFSVGLRDDARIKLKISGNKIPTDIMLLASIVDRLSILIWSNTEDAKYNRNQPASVVEFLLGSQTQSDVLGFDTIEQFEDKLKKLRGDLING